MCLQEDASKLTNRAAIADVIVCRSLTIGSGQEPNAPLMMPQAGDPRTWLGKARLLPTESTEVSQPTVL